MRWFVIASVLFVLARATIGNETLVLPDNYAFLPLNLTRIEAEIISLDVLFTPQSLTIYRLLNSDGLYDWVGFEPALPPDADVWVKSVGFDVNDTVVYVSSSFGSTQTEPAILQAILVSVEQIFQGGEGAPFIESLVYVELPSTLPEFDGYRLSVIAVNPLQIYCDMTTNVTNGILGGFNETEFFDWIFDYTDNTGLVCAPNDFVFEYAWSYVSSHYLDGFRESFDLTYEFTNVSAPETNFIATNPSLDMTRPYLIEMLITVTRANEVAKMYFSLIHEGTSAVYFDYLPVVAPVIVDVTISPSDLQNSESGHTFVDITVDARLTLLENGEPANATRGFSWTWVIPPFDQQPLDLCVGVFVATSAGQWYDEYVEGEALLSAVGVSNLFGSLSIPTGSVACVVQIQVRDNYLDPHTGLHATSTYDATLVLERYVAGTNISTVLAFKQSPIWDTTSPLQPFFQAGYVLFNAGTCGVQYTNDSCGSVTHFNDSQFNNPQAESFGWSPSQITSGTCSRYSAGCPVLSGCYYPLISATCAMCNQSNPIPVELIGPCYNTNVNGTCFGGYGAIFEVNSTSYINGTLACAQVGPPYNRQFQYEVVVTATSSCELPPIVQTFTFVSQLSVSAYFSCSHTRSVVAQSPVKFNQEVTVPFKLQTHKRMMAPPPVFNPDIVLMLNFTYNTVTAGFPPAFLANLTACGTNITCVDDLLVGKWPALNGTSIGASLDAAIVLWNIAQVSTPTPTHAPAINYMVAFWIVLGLLVLSLFAFGAVAIALTYQVGKSNVSSLPRRGSATDLGKVTAGPPGFHFRKMNK
jgi:hypothetical protein